MLRSGRTPVQVGERFVVGRFIFSPSAGISKISASGGCWCVVCGATLSSGHCSSDCRNSRCCFSRAVLLQSVISIVYSARLVKSGFSFTQHSTDPQHLLHDWFALFLWHSFVKSPTETESIDPFPSTGTALASCVRGFVVLAWTDRCWNVNTWFQIVPRRADIVMLNMIVHRAEEGRCHRNY